MIGIAKKVLNFLFNRITIVVAVLVVQFAWWIFVLFLLTNNSFILDALITVIAIILVLVIINKDMDMGYKLSWTIMILGFPIVGIVVYFIMGKSRVARKYRSRMEKVWETAGGFVKEKPEVGKHLKEQSSTLAGEAYYLTDRVHWPCYENTATRYYSVGEDWYGKYLEELRKAEKFIFLEYFILAKGYMWDTVLDILEEKAKRGVDVRVVYDGIGCLVTLPNKYWEQLEALGIKCACYQPFRPVLNVIQNNRDHRKITVIDGHTAFMGGINLADEYINQNERFGHWKDSGLYIHGEAAANLTAMFLQMWSVVYSSDVQNDRKLFCKNENEEEGPGLSAMTPSGFVRPYSASPIDGQNVGETVYLNIIGAAKKYVYIFTPYLIPNQSILSALRNAAGRGVDVRIVTPGVPDKRLIFALTQSFYPGLLEAGVRIYEYTPGFLHSKVFVSDDETAAVTTVNLDYRSLYLHFECGCLLMKTESVKEIKEDFRNTFTVSREITLKECTAWPRIKKLGQGCLRAIAPIL